MKTEKLQHRSTLFSNIARADYDYCDVSWRKLQLLKLPFPMLLMAISLSSRGGYQLEQNDLPYQYHPAPRLVRTHHANMTRCWWWCYLNTCFDGWRINPDRDRGTQTHWTGLPSYHARDRHMADELSACMHIISVIRSEMRTTSPDKTTTEKCLPTNR